MTIPNAQSAFVPTDKLGDYLLNVAHPVGGPKARWLMSLGYHPDRPDQLAEDLMELVGTSSDHVDESTRFGVKYIVRGQLDSPSGTRVNVVTVWIVESDSADLRLVTVYPDRRAEDE